MRNPSDTGTSSVISIRVSPDERALLEAASEQARTSLGEFVRRKALEAAEFDILEWRLFTIPANEWNTFQVWVKQPAKPIPALKRLARRQPTWQR